MSNSLVAVVILNWNGKAFLERFLPVVKTHTPAWADVVVADNGSTDGSVSWLRSAHADVQIIELPENMGFAGGYNAALERVDARYFVLLNSDMEVTPRWIKPVIDLMESNPNLAACQPKIRSFDRPAYFEYAGASGGYLDHFGYPFCRGRIFDTLEEDLGQYDDPAQVFWATGACLFVRADVFRQLGGFDERFFAHMEEIDLCWRLHHAGYEVMVCPESVVYHVGAGTLPKSSPKKTFLNFRNSLWMLAKNLPTRVLFRALLFRTIFDKLAAIRFLFQGQTQDFLAVFKAHIALYRNFKSLREEAKNIPRKKPDMIYKRSIVLDYYLRGRKTYNTNFNREGRKEIREGG